MDPLDDAQLAADLVRAAGDLAARMRAEGIDVDRKTSITDVVSSADRAAEAMITAQLALHRPLDGLVGEEGARSSAQSGRTWYVDPVDGTFNFVQGLSAWCSAVGLEVDGQPALGAVYHPAQDELWVGGPGVPTTLNGARVAPLADLPLAQLPLATYIHYNTLGVAAVREPIIAAMAATSTVRMLGSGSVELAALAGGRLGVWMQQDSAPWDWLPGAALVIGAGGVARTIPVGGHRWHIAGPANAVAELAELVIATSTTSSDHSK
ncbi:MAG: inositol monophosphatase family protein [Jatrophihabitantaceae bacterium]|nr:inositol monophosphatase family protein [Jatrophihabitantaceae bacterium]